MTPRVPPNPRSQGFLTNPAHPGSVAEPHLDELTLRSLARGGLTKERATKADSHLEHCTGCRRQFLRFASADEEKEQASTVAGDDEVPPVVALIGSIECGDRALANATGLPPEVLEALLQDLRHSPSSNLQTLVAEAEQLADRVTDGRYGRLKRRLASGRTANAFSDTFEDPNPPLGTAVGWAFGDEPLEYWTSPTEGTFAGDTRFELSVTSEPRSGGWVTRVSCACSEDIDFTWGFRLEFSPEAVLGWLQAHGFSPRHLGALRLADSEAAWPAILDVLVPVRHGEAGDTVFDRATRGPLPGPLPGPPRRVRFWVVLT